MFEHLEADFDLEPITVSQDHIGGRKAQVRAHQDEMLGTVLNQNETDLVIDRLPDQIQAQKRELFDLSVQVDGYLLEILSARIKQLSQAELFTIFARPAAETALRRRIGISHHVAFGARDHMHQCAAGAISHLFEDGKHRCHSKIGVEHQQTPFAQCRHQIGRHGRHQSGDADFGTSVDQRWQLVLPGSDRFQSFMELGTKGDAEDFF